MDNLDDKINTLIRDKLISLIQENSARIKRITIKYTKTNKKHTLDHWQAYFDSFEKMFRSIPRDLCRVEREVRIKFVSDLPSERVVRLKTMINGEAEVLFNKLTDECQEEFEKLGAGKVFEERLDATRKTFNANLEEQIQKCLSSIEEEIGQGQKASVQELVELYGVKESFLHEINIIAPLQDIKALLDRTNGDSSIPQMKADFQEGFRKIFQELQESRLRDTATKDARKALKMEVARDTMTVRDIVVNALPFLEQLALPEEKRNPEVIRKSWKNFFDIIESQGERWEKAAPQFEPLYHFMCGGES